jgi:hypothetical protein
MPITPNTGSLFHAETQLGERLHAQLMKSVADPSAERLASPIVGDGNGIEGQQLAFVSEA